MKKILLAIIAFGAMVSATTMSAQQSGLYRTSYFMEGSTFRNYMNPAFRPYRGYVNIPVVGNLNVGMNTSGITVGSLLYPHANGKLVPFWDKDVTWDKLSAKLQGNNGLDLNVNTSIIGFGFYSGQGFWSFSLDLRTNVGFNIPDGMFAFLKQGSGSYDLSNISLGAEAYMSASLGYSRKIFENLTVGARINLLGGLGRVRAYYDRLQLTRGIEEWAVDARGTIDAAGVFTVDNDSEQPEYLDFGSIGADISKFGLAGTGVSFDIGAEYTLLDRITFSASVLDMGSVKWNSSIRGVAEENYSIREFGAGLDDLDLEGLYKFRRQAGEGSVKSKLYPTVLIGAELDLLGNDMLGVGILFASKKNQFVDRYSEVSFAITGRPIHWFSASINYVARKNKLGGGIANNLGAAINFHTSWINFFAGTDYMISDVTPKYRIPINQDRFNFYLGIAVPLGRDKSSTLPKLGI